MTGGIHGDEAPPVLLRFCRCLCRSWFELEASLWSKLGLGFLELIAQRLDSLRVGTLVIWGEIISGIGDVLGEPRDPAQDAFYRVLAFSSDWG